MESVIPKGHISHTRVGIFRFNRADSHTNTKGDITVSDQDILRASGNNSILGGWLHSNCIIEISDLDALNQDVGTCRIDSISV